MKRGPLADIYDTPVGKAAQEFGIDLTLTEGNLTLTPIERLRKLQRAVESMQRLRAEAKRHR